MLFHAKVLITKSGWRSQSRFLKILQEKFKLLLNDNRKVTLAKIKKQIEHFVDAKIVK